MRFRSRLVSQEARPPPSAYVTRDGDTGDPLAPPTSAGRSKYPTNAFKSKNNIFRETFPLLKKLPCHDCDFVDPEHSRRKGSTASNKQQRPATSLTLELSSKTLYPRLGKRTMSGLHIYANLCSLLNVHSNVPRCGIMRYTN